MLKVKNFGEPLEHDILNRLNILSTAEICDGMSEFNVTRCGSIDAGITPVSKNRHFVGVAYTVRAVGGNTFPVQYAIYNGKPGYVLLVDTGEYRDGPYLGELMATVAKNIGLVAVVIDGFIRDSDAIMQMDYTVFCKGFMPCKPSKFDDGEINAAISCGGIDVAPGDVLVGDCDGVVAIPRIKLKEVLMASEKKHLADSERKRKIYDFFADNQFNRKGLDVRLIMPDEVRKLVRK